LRGCPLNWPYYTPFLFLSPYEDKGTVLFEISPCPFCFAILYDIIIKNDKEFDLYARVAAQTDC
jgi:hypothetical protein